MKEWDYDWSGFLQKRTWGSLSKITQSLILEKHYPIGMYVDCGDYGSGKILGYDHRNFILIGCYGCGLHPYIVKPDIRQNRLEKLKKLGI